MWFEPSICGSRPASLTTIPQKVLEGAFHTESILTIQEKKDLLDLVSWVKRSLFSPFKHSSPLVFDSIGKLDKYVFI